jgi:hypothetical protein
MPRRAASLGLALFLLVACTPEQFVAPSVVHQEFLAQNIAFEPDQLTIPAGHPLQIVIDNRDPGVPHGLRIETAAQVAVFTGPIAVGPKRTTYDVPALAPGPYRMVCPVHPVMVVELVAT